MGECRLIVYGVLQEIGLGHAAMFPVTLSSGNANQAKVVSLNPL